MNIRNKIIQSVLTALILIGATSGLYLYTSGYRLKKNGGEKVDLTQTGMVSVKSLPDGANVYLDGQLKTATDGTVSGIEPGKHSLGIIKNGFVTWNKEIEVFSELVTDVTAILISQSPRLEPLTNTGARFPVISPTLNKIAFFSKDGSAPGVWVIPLTGEALNIFRSNPYVVLEDGPNNFYSRGKSIQWGPEEDALLVEDQDGNFVIVDLEDGGLVQKTSNPRLVKDEWAEVLFDKRTVFIERLDIPEDLKEIAVGQDALWAPDEKKFLYKTKVEETIEYRVYNMEKPIPVGENVESVVFTTNVSEKQPKVTWYADSFHLILAELDSQNEGRGKISLIRIDGTNRTEIYSNTLYSEDVFSAPGGDKLVILTSFKSGEQTDLYTVGIR